MTVPAFYWPSGNFAGRARCAAVVAGTIYIPSWDQYAMTLLQRTGSVVTLTPVTTSGPTPATTYSRAAGYGYLGCAADNAGNVFATGVNNTLFCVGVGVTGGHASSTLPGSAFYGPVATSGAQVFTASMTTGAVLKYANVAAAVAGTSTAFGTFSYGVSAMVADAVNLYAARSAHGDVAQMSLSSASVTALTGCPVALPAFLATSAAATGVAVAGWNFASVASGVAAVSISPAVATDGAISIPSANAVAVITGADPQWAVGAALTGLTGVHAIDWVPNGTQLVAAGSADVYILALTSGAFTLSQTLAVAGAGTNPSAVAVTSDSASALVCIPGSNSVAVLTNSVGTWSIGTAVAIGASPLAVVMITATTAAVVDTAGTVHELSRAGSVWSVTGSVSTAFSAVTGALLEPTTGLLAIIGTAAGVPTLSMVSPTAGTVSGTISWTGSANALVALNHQLAVLDTTSSLIRFFPAVPARLQDGGTQAPVAGTTALAATGQSLWMLSSTSASLAEMPTPYGYQRLKVGAVAVYTGGAWGSAYVLGSGHTPSAIAWNPAGSEIDVVTTQNDFYRLGVSGATLSLTSQTLVEEYSGYAALVPLGMSSLTWSAGALFATTSLSGVVVRLV